MSRRRSPSRRTAFALFVALAALLFAGIGLGFWIAPIRMAQTFGVAAAGGLGLANLRADFGGLFLGLAVLCGAGLYTRQPATLLSAAAILAAIVAGRLVGWVAEGEVVGLAEIALEITVLLTLLGATQGLTPTSARTPPSPR